MKRFGYHNFMQATYRIYWDACALCSSTDHLNTHHIWAFRMGGPSEFWNFICLCRSCHSDWGGNKDLNDDRQMELYTKKSFAELKRFGFVLDENDFGGLIELRTRLLKAGFGK